MLNIKVTVTETRYYQFNSIFMKLDHQKSIIKNFKKSGKCKIQLAKANNFIFSADNDLERVMIWKWYWGDVIEINLNHKANEVTEELF